VGPNPVYPVRTISLSITFGTEDNFRTENVQFEMAEVNLPFNAIISRPVLYRFMAVAHYGYLVLKMLSPAGVLTVQSDRAAAVVAVEKLHALATGLAPQLAPRGPTHQPRVPRLWPRHPRSVRLIRTMYP
jgi:hypothetical protein